MLRACAAHGRLLPITTLLFGLAALDELTSGVPIVGAPDVERSFNSSHAALALSVFLIPGIIALVVEPLVFLLADRYPRRWFIRGGLAAMAAGVLAAAIAPTAMTFALALAIVWSGSGTASGLAQATLVDRFPEERGRVLARWSMWSLAGDLVAPALLATLALLGMSWRVGFVIVGVLLGLWLFALVVTDVDDAPDTSSEPDEPHQPLLAALREALRDRALIAWLFGTTLCDLLDEILVVFASLHMRVELRASPLWQSAAIASLVIGGALGLVACERLLRLRSERWVLVASALATVACYVPWLFAPTPLVSTLLMLLVGACSAPLYPLAAAQAYARQPEASGAVLAAGHLFAPLALALPFVVGLVADAAGTGLALLLLIAQPLGLVVLVVATRVRALAATTPRASAD